MASNSNDNDFAPINVDVSDRIPVGNKRASSPSPQTPVQGVNKGLFTLVLLLGLGACAASAYLYTELQKSQETIIANQNRLQSLENRLSATGEEMGNSTVELQVKLGELAEKTEELWDQMDKLWASAWRRNQEEIKELNADLTRLSSNVSSTVDELTKKANSAQSGTQQLMTRIDSLNSKITEQANNVLAVKVESEGFMETNAAHSSDIRELKEKILILEKRNTNLLQQLNQVETQVKELTVKTL